MAKIAIANLSPAGSDLFLDSDSFLTDLTDIELEGTKGGATFLFAAGFVAGVGLGIAISKLL